MTATLNEIAPKQKTGNEYFHQDGNILKNKLIDFWSWSGSDLLNNTTRGWLAEYIVSLAFEINDKVRLEWAPFDIQLNNGYCIEVKSSSYIQSWKQKEYAKIRFGIAPRKMWNSKTGKYEATSRRSSHFYIFCVLKEKVQEKIDPMDINQWDFYIIPTYYINEKLGSQKSIGLKKLIELKAILASFKEIKPIISEFIKKDESKILNNFNTLYYE